MGDLLRSAGGVEGLMREVEEATNVISRMLLTQCSLRAE